MKKINWIIGLFNIKPVIIDGALAVIIGVLGYCLSEMSSEEAYKYWNAYVLYFGKFFFGSLSAGFVTLNFFRSKSYSDHRKEQETKQAIKDGNSIVTTQTTEIKTNETSQIPTPISAP